MKPVIGIIGLGIIGSAMAEALVNAGYRVVGYDVHATPRQRFERVGERCLASCAAVASNADVLITSLPWVAALDDVVKTIAPACAVKPKSRPRLIAIETSTLPIADKER